MKFWLLQRETQKCARALCFIVIFVYICVFNIPNICLNQVNKIKQHNQ